MTLEYVKTQEGLSRVPDIVNKRFKKKLQKYKVLRSFYENHSPQYIIENRNKDI